MREIIRLGWKLLLLAAVAGLALGVTNAVTEGPIEQQRIEEANRARQAVLGAADSFEILSEGEHDMDEIACGLDAAGETVGYTARCTVQGYGGPIEVTVGLLLDGAIAGVNVGGVDFAETTGLGARVKEPWFGEQYVGLEPPVALTGDGGTIDAVSSATISSNAVTSAVNAACDVLVGLLEGN